MSPTNNERADFAAVALDAFEKEVYAAPDTEEPATVLQDLVTNLMHWSDWNGVDFNAALSDAGSMYVQEIEEDGGPARK